MATQGSLRLEQLAGRRALGDERSETAREIVFASETPLLIKKEGFHQTKRFLENTTNK